MTLSRDVPVTDGQDQNVQAELASQEQSSGIDPFVVNTRGYDPLKTDVTMQSVDCTVVPAPSNKTVGPFGDVLESFRNRPDEFNVSKDDDVTTQSSAEDDKSSGYPSLGNLSGAPRRSRRLFQKR